MQAANRNAFVVWLILVGLTLVTYAVGRFGYGGYTVVALLLLSVTIKGQLLIDFFMGLAGVQSKLKWLVTGWLLLVASLIGLAYWTGVN